MADTLIEQESGLRGEIEHRMQMLDAVYRAMQGSGQPALVARGREGLRRLMVARGYLDGSIEAAQEQLDAADAAGRERIQPEGAS